MSETERKLIDVIGLEQALFYSDFRRGARNDVIIINYTFLV
jgi:hypothetical protein